MIKWLVKETNRYQILTEAAFLIVEGTFPLRNDGPGLVHDEIVVGRTAVTVLPSYTGQTDTLASVGITATANSKLCVAATLLAAIRAEVPEAIQTPLAFLSRHSGLAGTLASQEVALRELTGLATLTGQTPVRSVLVKSPVVSLALITPRTPNPGQTETLPSLVITLLGPIRIAVTRPAVLQSDGVTEEPRLAPLAVLARSVMETELTHPRHSVTSSRVREVDITITLTGLTEAPGNLWLSEVSWTTVLTSVSTVVWLTDTLLSHCGRSGRDITGDGKTEQNINQYEKQINPETHMLSGRGQGQGWQASGLPEVASPKYPGAHCSQ